MCGCDVYLPTEASLSGVISDGSSGDLRGMKTERARGVRQSPKRKLSRQQIDHARKLIEEGQRREDVADFFKMGRVTLYRAQAG